MADSNSPAMPQTLEEQAPLMALAMHRLFHVVVAKSRIAKSLKAYAALEVRQVQDEEELCARIARMLENGVPAARITSIMDKNPSLSTACKRIFPQWVDVAELRAASEGSPAKVRRLMKDECIEARRHGGT